VESGRVRATVADGDPYEHVLRCGLGIFHENVEIAVVPKNARVEKLVLPLGTGARPVGPNQVLIRVGLLRVLVEVFHVGMGGCAVEVIIVFLDVLPVVPLLVGQAEQPLLDDGVVPVPQGRGEAQNLALVAQSRQPVLSPAVGAGTGLVVGEVVPGVSRVAVILPHGPPLPLAEVRTPEFPCRLALPSLDKSHLFCVHCTLPRRHKGWAMTT
jgi:hypothetical protein